MEESMKPRTAAIFDLDGTLLDSMGVWVWVDKEFLARRRIVMPADYSEALAPMGFPAAAAYTKKRFSLPESEDAIMDEWHEMAMDAYAHNILCKPHAREYLLYLKENGIRCAAATASQPEFYVPALKRLRIFDLFESITEVAEVRRGKGFPDIYLRAAEKMKLTPGDCVVFEDIAAGMRGAKDGGFFGVGVYEALNRDREELKRISDLYIDDFSVLMPDGGQLFGIR
ncbi:MAG: HAD family phosphatase [Clostridia bacterium]|nr:HAD family phosphatase [Clostridia bacterium]